MIVLSPHNCPMQIVDAQHGLVKAVGERRKKVIISAFGPSLSALRQFHDDPTWEIWGLNNGYRNPAYYDAERRMRVDLWFDLHEMHAQPDDDMRWLMSCPMPVYIPELDSRIPNGVRFPVERCEQLINLPGPFWACSFSYMIALAIVEGFSEIALLGLEWYSPREWLFERPNVSFWAGFAAGRGVTLHLPTDTEFVWHPHRYGLEYDAEKLWCEQQVHALRTFWDREQPLSRPSELSRP